MGDVEFIVLFIAQVCGVHLGSPNYNKSKEYKSMCIERMVNCAIKEDGKMTPENAKKCAKEEVL